MAAALVCGSLLATCGGDDADTGTQAQPPVTLREAATPEAKETPAAEQRATRRPVSRKRAISIARKRAGGGRVSEVERDDEDGRTVWKVKLRRRRVEHKVSVAVASGRVVKHARDRDDRDRDRDDGDDRDDRDDG